MKSQEYGNNQQHEYLEVITVLRAAQANHDLFCTIASYYPDSGITIEEHEEVTTSIIGYAAETLTKYKLIAGTDTVSGLVVGAGIKDTQILVMLRQPNSNDIIPIDVNLISHISPISSYQIPMYYSSI
jgi:hypothetical protein